MDDLLDVCTDATHLVEDFTRSYLIFHDLDIKKPIEFFKYLAELNYVSMYICQIDAYYKALLPMYGAPSVLTPFLELSNALRSRNLLTTRIEAEFRDAELFWARERMYCGPGIQISPDEVDQMLRLKSFKYRVLNLLMYGLRRQEVNDVHMHVMSFSDVLLEIRNDTSFYEADITSNRFNSLRRYSRFYGATNAITELSKKIQFYDQMHAVSLGLLDVDLSTKVTEGLNDETDWMFPSVIRNENL